MTRAVVVGGGQAGVETASSLRLKGFEGEVVLLSGEPAHPYHRPPLSKEYLAGKSDVAGNPLRGESFFQTRDVQLRRDARVVQIDRAAAEVTVASGERFGYDQLVLATGSTPRTLPVPGAELAGVATLRRLEDACQLREQLPQARHVVVLGAGFIGMECAATASGLGVPVTVVEMAEQALGRVVSRPTAEFVVDRHREAGNTVLFGRKATEFRGENGAVRAVVLDDGSELPADLVIVGVGITPNTELAESAGLAVANGIVVDELLRTEDPRIYAVGDCANYPSVHAGSRIRLESVQNAVEHGQCVAQSIAGSPAPYRAVPWFWTHQLAMRLQIAGLAHGDEDTVRRPGSEPGSFSMFRYRGEQLTAVESMNHPRIHMAARKLLGGGVPLAREQAADPDYDLKAHLSG